MAMKGSSKPQGCNSSRKIHYKYLKPGALAKLRDSKITARHKHYSRNLTLSLSEFSLSPLSPSSLLTQEEEQPSPNQDNGVPCFVIPSVNLNRPRCLLRKKLFAVTPYFTHAEEYNF